MKQTFYIHEDDQGQSLRAEIGEEDIVLISHELSGGGPIMPLDDQKQWRERHLATINIHVWRAIAHIAGE